MFDKLRNEKGEVALIITTAFGCGWATENEMHFECIYDPEIARMVIDGRSPDDVEALAKKKWPDGNWSAAGDLEIVWLAERTNFQVHNNDGQESIVLRDSQHWIEA
ncbi:MAG: hypothetical protein EOP19_06770 [Hyphomicrobiales bacterium]|nr:MAG: hypothetical protein EOP19_06770 [Hyphomicrobiales bacterium]